MAFPTPIPSYDAALRTAHLLGYSSGGLCPVPDRSPPSSRLNEPAPATSSTALDQVLGQTPPGPQASATVLDHRRHSATHPFGSVSPLQNPRVRNSLQGLSGINTHHAFYASSAPQSSINVLQSPRQRPPVPLFTHNSTGIASRAPGPSMDSNHSHNDMSSDHFDFASEHYMDSDEASLGLMFHDATAADFNFAMPAFEPINPQRPAPPTDTPRTISPRDVFIDSMSAPPSSAISHLSTPMTYSFESPYMDNSTDTSPMYPDDTLGDEAETWGSLFPLEHSPSVDAMPEEHMLPPVDSRPVPMSRNVSSTNTSPGNRAHGRHSSVAGVAARKRDKPLPPIRVEDPTDIVQVKRARNTAAARKSREKKMQRFEEQEVTIAELQAEVQKWKSLALAHHD